MKKFNHFRNDSLEEVLKASDPTGKWIDDFVNSKNPKFAGKSKEQRIRMALGASYGVKNEESEICSICEYDPCICDDSHGFVTEDADKGEYDYEGQMARTQLQTTMRNCQDLIGMIEDGDNMPEWVQSKITLAQDYITTVRDYLQSKEELGEDKMIELGDLAVKKALKHRVLVTYSDPNHTMVSQRKEKQQKHVRIPSTNKQGETIFNGDAVDLAKQYVKKQGHKVHDAEHVGLVNVKEGSLNELSKDTLKSYSNERGATIHADQRDAGGARTMAADKKKHGDTRAAADWDDEASWLDKRAEKGAKGVAQATTKIAKKGVAEAVTYEPSPGARPNKAGHTLVGFSFHSDNTKHANIMKHGETGKYYAAGGSSSHPVKSTTFHDTPEDAVKSKKSYVKESAQTKDQIDDVHKIARYLSAKEGVIHHVNKDPETGEHHVSDWYHHENTVATYNNGRKKRD